MDVLFPAPSREQFVHALYEAAEIEISGTGRLVARVTTARLCRCGASNTKPFCDGSHVRIEFKSN